MTLAKRSLTGERVGRLPASGIRRFFDLAAGIPGGSVTDATADLIEEARNERMEVL